VRRPLLKRLLAALLLFGVAIGSALYWSEGELVLWYWKEGKRLTVSALPVNLIVAFLGCIWLHFRWRARERRALDPSKVKDIFS
jgi:uncharacterized membrane protein YqjE